MYNFLPPQSHIAQLIVFVWVRCKAATCIGVILKGIVVVTCSNTKNTKKNTISERSVLV
jgi:hypothetical protein